MIGIVSVQAECTAEESNKLSRLAVNVKANYEEAKKEATPDDNYNPPDGLDIEDLEDMIGYHNIFKIYIQNITEELYVKVFNKQTNETNTYYYSDAVNGVITIEQEDLTRVTNYTITVYSSDKTNCPDSKLHTTYLTTPMFNTYSEFAQCEGVEEFYLCHEYLTVETVSFDKFLQLVSDYRKGKIDEDGGDVKPEEPDKGFTDFIKDNKGIIITASIIIVAVGGLVTVIIVKKQRSKII